MTRRLPLDDLHRSLEARLGEERGFFVPQSYGELADELGRLRRATGLVDLSDRGVVVATGSERAVFLQGQLSNDVAALRPGEGCRATLLTRTGKLVSDLVVSAFGDCHVLDMEPDRADPARAALDRFLISEDAELEDATGQWARIAVAGPHAAACVAAVTGADPSPLAPFAHRALGDGAAAADDGPVVPRLAHRPSRGLPVWELWLAPDAAQVTWDRLVQAGGAPVGREAWDLAGLEAGEARFGVDMDESSNPLEAHLTDAISYTKGCYVGQEVIAKATHLGRVAKQLCGLDLAGGPLPGTGAAVEVDGEAVGHVTRAALSPTLGRPIALAVLKRKQAEPGTRVRVVCGESAVVEAVVAALPFVGGTP